MNKQNYSKLLMGGLLSAALMGGAVVSGNANATSDLPPQDSMVTTTFDSSVINGSLLHDANGNLIYDTNGNARFAYTGQIYSVKTDGANGQLMARGPQIGTISGEAAFPKQFVAMTAGINQYMQAYDNYKAEVAAGDTDASPPAMPKMPSVVRWTCNHCDMTVDGTRYLSIVDVLNPVEPDGVTPNPDYDSAIVDAFDRNLMDGSVGALQTMRMDGRAFTGFGPASFNPVARTVSVRMAGCSALVAVSGPEAGKIGDLCMNATATFNVKDAIASSTDPNGYAPTSQVSANGSSNCVTVMQPMSAH